MWNQEVTWERVLWRETGREREGMQMSVACTYKKRLWCLCLVLFCFLNKQILQRIWNFKGNFDSRE